MQIHIEKHKKNKNEKHINSNEFYAKRLKPMQIHNKNTKKTKNAHKQQRFLCKTLKTHVNTQQKHKENKKTHK